MIKNLLKDLTMTPKSIKISFIVICILLISSSVLITSCGIVTPSKGFILKNEQRAELHLKRYQMLINNIKERKDKSCLEKLLSEAPGSFKDFSERQFNRLCDRLVSELNSWLAEIKANALLVKSLDKKTEVKKE